MKIKYLLAALLLALSGCATTFTLPASGPAPVDMSSYSTPSEGKSGIYFYQWKSGIWGAYRDVRFRLDDKVMGKINTGEWLYLEVPAGPHELRYQAGIFPLDMKFDFVEGQNYFFRGAILNGSPFVLWVNDREAIDKAIKNIESGRYEHGSQD